MFDYGTTASCYLIDLYYHFNERYRRATISAKHNTSSKNNLTLTITLGHGAHLAGPARFTTASRTFAVCHVARGIVLAHATTKISLLII